MLVYVLDKHGKPLMPCSPGKARRLLDEKKAKVVSREPFTIALLFGSFGYKQKVALKCDTGSQTAGFAAVRKDGKTLYASEVKMRTDISEKMEARRSYRRTRRGRKTRYRQARWSNRKRPDGWLTPTLHSKVQAHVRELELIKSKLPVSEVALEVASFDIHKITDPEVSRWTYTKGRQKDFYNVKAYILSRDKHTCQKCSGKKKDEKLHVHHIMFRKNGGTNSPENLITLCETCHNNLHASPDAEKESKKLQKKRQANTKDAVQVSTIGSYLKNIYPNARVCFGYETKWNREVNQLPKAHFIDAMCVGLSDGELVTVPSNVYIKRIIARGSYQQTEPQPRRAPNPEQIRPRITREKIFGFKTLDKVKYGNTICFIKGRMSTGYAILMNIDGEKLDFGHTPKLSLTKRISARKSCLTCQKTIENFTSSTISYLSANIEKVYSKTKRSA